MITFLFKRPKNLEETKSYCLYEAVYTLVSRRFQTNGSKDYTEANKTIPNSYITNVSELYKLNTLTVSLGANQSSEPEKDQLGPPVSLHSSASAPSYTTLNI